MKARVERHAVRQYISRVLGKNPEDTSPFIWEVARTEVEEAIFRPDWVYHGKEDMPQIHVRNEVAVPVGVEKHGRDRLTPYESTEENLVVPTSYHAKVFEKKRNDNTARGAA